MQLELNDTDDEIKVASNETYTPKQSGNQKSFNYSYRFSDEWEKILVGVHRTVNFSTRIHNIKYMYKENYVDSIFITTKFRKNWNK